MNKLLLPILLLCVCSCQKKVEEQAANHIEQQVEYKTPPANTIADAIDATTNALNNRDSAAYWKSLVWENRGNSSFYADAYRYARTVWDSSAGSHLDVRIIRTSIFWRTVRTLQDTALFAHAVIS